MTRTFGMGNDTDTEADDNDTGWLVGAKYGSVKDRGDWDFTYFYENLEADATVGLLADSDFGGGGTNSEGHEINGTIRVMDGWDLSVSLFLNETGIAKGDKEEDYTRLQIDIIFKF